MAEKIYQFLLNYAFWLLGRRDYSEKEMKGKLHVRLKNAKKKRPDFAAELSTGGEEAAIEKTMARLKELHYLDDERFAKVWITNRLATNPKGAFALRFELLKKGISKELFESVWDEIRIPDEALVQRIIDRKQKSIDRLSPEKRKKKVMSLLASRGIPPSVIYRFFENFE